jgi:glycerate 2-kinase
VSAHTSRLRSDAERAWRAGLAAVDPEAAVRGWLAASPEPFADLDRTLVVATGKAAASMIRGVGEAARGFCLLPTALDAGVLPPTVEVLRGGHPVPTAAGIDASRRILDAVAALSRGQRLLYLVSGGTSALFEVPAAGIDVDALIEVYAMLLGCGAPIEEINAVRRAMSTIKGGGLARAAAPAAVLTLAVSDVGGDHPEVIGSGPTVESSTRTGTAREAVAVLRERGLWSRVPAGVARALERAVTSEPDPDVEPVLEGFAVVCSVADAVSAARAELAVRSYACRQLEGADATLRGDAARGAERLVPVIREMAQRPGRSGLVLGGETTVELPADFGSGGRNRHLAAVLAAGLRGCSGFACVSAGTDGCDGAGDAAGAIVDGGTADRASAAGCPLAAAISGFDSGRALAAAGDALVTGPTGTNVGDLLVVTARGPAEQ